jgi:hypothetical protein
MATHETDFFPEPQYSSTVDLEEYDPTLTLGSKPPKEITETSTMAFRQPGGQVTCDIVSVAHGTHGRKLASLLGFSFKFPYESPGKWKRITEAEIEISFRPAQAGDMWPEIKLFAPTYIHGDIQSANVNTTIAGNFSLSPAGQVPVGGSVEMGRGMDYNKQYGTTIGGSCKNSDDAFDADVEHYDTVTWKVMENKLQCDGIPSEIKTAVLLGPTEESYHLIVVVKVKTAFPSFLLAQLWPQKRPMLIKRSVSFGLHADKIAFDELGLDDWQSLVGWNKPYEVK